MRNDTCHVWQIRIHVACITLLTHGSKAFNNLCSVAPSPLDWTNWHHSACKLHLNFCFPWNCSTFDLDKRFAGLSGWEHVAVRATSAFILKKWSTAPDYNSGSVPGFFQERISECSLSVQTATLRFFRWGSKAIMPRSRPNISNSLIAFSWLFWRMKRMVSSPTCSLKSPVEE